MAVFIAVATRDGLVQRRAPEILVVTITSRARGCPVSRRPKVPGVMRAAQCSAAWRAHCSCGSRIGSTREKATPTPQLGVQPAPRPRSRSVPHNLLTEMIATFVLILGALVFRRKSGSAR